jgi:hypothetical protein
VRAKIKKKTGGEGKSTERWTELVTEREREGGLEKGLEIGRRRER